MPRCRFSVIVVVREIRSAASATIDLHSALRWSQASSRREHTSESPIQGAEPTPRPQLTSAAALLSAPVCGLSSSLLLFALPSPSLSPPLPSFLRLSPTMHRVPTLLSRHLSRRSDRSSHGSASASAVQLQQAAHTLHLQAALPTLDQNMINKLAGQMQRAHKCKRELRNKKQSR